MVFASRSGETPILGYRKMWLRIAKLGGLPADITPHVLRHSFASLAADLGYNEPTIASLLGHKTHSITSRYVHSADAVLLGSRRCRGECHHEADGLGPTATPVAGTAARWISRAGRNHLFIGVFVTHGFGRSNPRPHLPSVVRSPHEENGGTSALLASRNLGRDQIILPTRARHSSLQVRQCPYEFAGALLAGCLGEMRRYRRAGFSGGAVRSTNGCFGDGGGEGCN